MANMRSSHRGEMNVGSLMTTDQLAQLIAHHMGPLRMYWVLPRELVLCGLWPSLLRTRFWLDPNPTIVYLVNLYLFHHLLGHGVKSPPANDDCTSIPVQLLTPNRDM